MKKSGFHIPLAEWFCGPLKEFVLSRLASSRIDRVGFLDCQAVKVILDEHFARRADNSFKINNLLILVEWFHQFVVGRGRSRLGGDGSPGE
jgi:asparagine synthase (glutamine-hydrolysing)